MKKKRKLSLTKKRAIAGFLFISPWLLGFLLFYIRSLVMTFRFSFSNLTMGVGGYELEFTGLENLIYAFRVHGQFKQTLTTSVLNMLVDVPLITFFSLFMAMILNRKFKGRGLVRAIFFLPVILGADAISEAMELAETMMNGGVATQAAEITASTSGTLSFDIDYLIQTFMNLGIPVKLLDYIAQAVDRINTIIAASGVQIIIFIAALQSIPGSLYEVSKIEGATAYETFWKVTFPMVMPHIITNVVYTIVDNFSKSEIVELAKTEMFGNFNYGLGSVFSIVSTLITCGILILIVWLIQKRTFYYN
ncbi:MAG: sugar ABC transporter permease [Lachnospiraceae bacterium]|nr:sugar ABC transporter permease [Lachnospiraceae bacterium]